MGYDVFELYRVTVRVSRHNSDRDVEDNKLAEELKEELDAVCKQKRYEKIGVYA